MDLDPLAAALAQSGLAESAVARACFAETVGAAPAVDALLATGEVSPEAYATAVRAVYGVPAVEPKVLASLPEAVGEWLPVDVAGRGPYVPLSKAPRLVVASDRPDPEAAEALSEVLGTPVDLVYAPPGALREAFRRIYRVVGPEDFYRRGGERSLEAEFEFAPAAPTAEARGAGDGADPARLEASLLEAGSSREILVAVLEWLCGTYDAAAFFVTQGDLVAGRLARGAPDLERVVFSRRVPTLFGRVLKTGRPHSGPPPAHLADAAIHRRLGRPLPASVLYLPLSMDGVCVGLIYADTPRPGVALGPPVTAERLGRMTVAALEDLFARHVSARYAAASDGVGHAEPGGFAEAAAEPVAALAATHLRDDAAVKRVVALGTAAVDALLQHFPGRLRIQVAGSPRAEDPEAWSELLRAVVRMGEAGQAVALAAMSAESPLKRQFGALCFTRLPRARAVPALLALLSDEAPEVREAAAAALAVRGGGADEEIVARLLRGLDEGDEETARLAAGILGRRGTLRALPHLLRRLARSPHVDAYEEALRRITFHGPPGRDRARAWTSWWRERSAAGETGRLDLAVRALTESDLTGRRAALAYLRRTTGLLIPFDVEASKRQRARAAERFRAALHHIAARR